MTLISIVLLSAACFAAGITNAIAGGGSFMTFPALLLTGLDPRAANMTSTIALFPMQVGTGFAVRHQATGTPTLSVKDLMIVSLIGGLIGAVLLLITPESFFARLVPWLILMATGLFAYGSFKKKPHNAIQHPHLGRWGALTAQMGISIYGGYFGAGIGFLMLAALTLAGMQIRQAGATKNILAAAINIVAVIIFAFSKDIGWAQTAIGITASSLGGWFGVKILHKVNERILRIIVITIGMAMTIAMFVRG